MLLRVTKETKLPDEHKQILISTDPEGRNPITFFDKKTIEKNEAYVGIFSDTAYFHYPVCASQVLGLSLN